MAEEMKQKQNNITDEEVDITKDRGVLDFLHGKKADHKVSSHESNDNTKEEQHKKHNLLDKLHRSNSSTSSSSEEEIEVDCVKQKRKKNKKKGGEVVTADPNHENKGLLDKIKEKLPGQHKKTDHQDEGISVSEDPNNNNNNEKKGILEKIKEKLPGYHSHSNETQKQNDTTSASHH